MIQEERPECTRNIRFEKSYLTTITRSCPKVWFRKRVNLQIACRFQRRIRKNSCRVFRGAVNYFTTLQNGPPSQYLCLIPSNRKRRRRTTAATRKRGVFETRPSLVRAPVPEVDIARTWLKSNKGGPAQRAAKREWGKTDSRAGTKKRGGSRNGTATPSGST